MYKKRILIAIAILLILIAIIVFLIYNYNVYTLKIQSIENGYIYAVDKDNTIYLISSPDLIIDITFNKLEISSLKDGDILFVLEKAPKITYSIGFTNENGIPIERLHTTKLIILLKEGAT